jgi:hypothetical protein
LASFNPVNAAGVIAALQLASAAAFVVVAALTIRNWRATVARFSWRSP